MNLLDSISKRDLLAARKFDPAVVRRYAEDFLARQMYGDAFEFYRKIGDEAGIRGVKQAAIETGNPDVLWQIEHADRSGVTAADWEACGDQAVKSGKFRNAAFAFRHAGAAEKQAAAEREFTPAAGTPSAPK